MEIDIPEEIHGRAFLSGSGNSILIRGELDQNEPHLFLDPFFEKVEAQMSELVVIDIRELHFLNSSAIGCILDFLVRRKAGSKIIIKIDKNKVWQKVAMDVVQTLDEDHISLELHRIV